MTKQIELPSISLEAMRVRVEGVTPLAINKFPDDDVELMFRKQQGEKVPRQPKGSAEEEMARKMHLLPDGRPGITTAAFRGSLAAAARFYGKSVLAMTEVRQSVFVRGGVGADDLLAIESANPPECWTAPVSVGRTKDVRHRPRWDKWEVEFILEWASTFNAKTVLTLLDTAGHFCGVGEWRPASPDSNTGWMGRYQIKETYPL